MADYNYNIGDFANDKVCEDRLKLEISANETIQTALSAIKTRVPEGELGTCTLAFESSLTVEEQTALDGIVAAHSGMPLTEMVFHASSKLVESGVAITEPSSWQLLGGVVTTPSFFSKSVSALLGRMVGSCKALGSGAKLRVMEDGTREMASYDIPDTSDAWQQMQWFTTLPPTEGTHEYTIEGQLDGATSASIRFVSMSLLEVK